MIAVLARHLRRYCCPKCGSIKLSGKSRQCCADGCEMWFECANCGWYPDSDKIETVMGWDNDLTQSAANIWISGVIALAQQPGEEA